MRSGPWVSGLAVVLITTLPRWSAAADSPASGPGGAPAFSDVLSQRQVPPVRLAIIDQPESVYPQVVAQEPPEPLNAGSVHFDLNVSYLTRYVFRGVDQTTLPNRSENSLQFNGTAEFDLGKLPHPFVGLFVNVFNQDPIARFEEVRPIVGLAWTIKPLTIDFAYQSFIFPNRKNLDTQEVWTSITLDDSRFWNTDRPVFTPYIFGAYDFERYFGFYIEGGVKHDFVIEDTGLTLTPSASIAYVATDRYFLLAPRQTDTGFQHYEVGLTLSYSLNNVLNIPARFGQWRLKGYLFDDQRINNHLRSDTRLFGGGGLEFSY